MILAPWPLEVLGFATVWAGWGPIDSMFVLLRWICMGGTSAASSAIHRSLLVSTQPLWWDIRGQ